MKKLSMIILILSFGIILTGCGGDNSSVLSGGSSSALPQPSVNCGGSNCID